MFDLIVPIIIAICLTVYFIIDRICEMEETKAVAESEKDFEDEED